ncbi:MAG: 5-(carboxyamino)imidazole ribonucleotide mutase [Clostridia bacterium]|nr:5-(carboxyamino)imidazole ribonucleotide mutase [Clostridia bacterium]MDD4679498.1 5-(carboxyamino)imidazole ribonucleotide mutase [Clostridia bacterium]
MGSDSDFPILKKCIRILKEFQIETEVHVISAHRTPYQAEEFARNAESNGFGVIIAAAGKAAHLAGVIAAYTILPVIGLPIKSPTMDGLDSLLSMVQMPKGIPVAAVAIDGAENAALLAVQILSLGSNELKARLKVYKEDMAEQTMEKDQLIQKELEKL